MEALQEQDEEDQYNGEESRREDPDPSVLSVGPETNSQTQVQAQAHAHRPEQPTSDTLNASTVSPTTSVQCYSARTEYNFESRAYDAQAGESSGSGEWRKSASRPRPRPHPRRRLAYSLELDDGSEPETLEMEMELEREMTRLSSKSYHRVHRWNREPNLEDDNDDDDNDDGEEGGSRMYGPRWQYFRKHARRMASNADSKTKMAMLIRRQRHSQNQDGTPFLSSIVDKTYFNPVDDGSSSGYCSSVFADTDADTDASFLSLLYSSSSLTTSSPPDALTSKFLLLPRSILRAHRWDSKMTLNYSLLAWAIFMNLITFYVYWHTEQP